MVTVLYHAVLDCRNNVSKGTKLGGVLVRKTDTQVSSITVSSVAQSCPTLCVPMDCSTPGFPSITNPQSLLRLMSIKSGMPSSHLILCRPLLLLPPIPPSIRVFSNDSTLRMRWPKYWSFSFNISPSSEHPGLISFRMDWLDLLAVQETLKSLLQHHSSQKHQFFGTQLSSQSNSHSVHDHWKNHSLD